MEDNKGKIPIDYQDKAKTILMLLVNAAGAEFENEQLAVEILTENFKILNNMKKQKFIEILKANSITRQNGAIKEYVFSEEHLEACSEELDHRINVLNH